MLAQEAHAACNVLPSTAWEYPEIWGVGLYMEVAGKQGNSPVSGV